MPEYEMTVTFTNDERKVLHAVVRDLSIAYPDFYHGSTVDPKRAKREGLPIVAEEARALKAASLNNEPFLYRRVVLALAAAQQQFDTCTAQSDPAYWQAMEQPGVDPEVSARYGEARMGAVLAEARAEQAGRARDAVNLLVEVVNVLMDAERDLLNRDRAMDILANAGRALRRGETTA